MEVRSRDPLPEYECPPVIEVVCGLQFAPLVQFQATALGLFWQRIRGEYPSSQPQPPLVHVVEQLDAPSAENAPIELTEFPPLPRMFFVDRSENWLIQLQPGRFLHNWRREHDAETYPRFPIVFERFWRAWRQFLDFCRDERIAPPGSINSSSLTSTTSSMTKGGKAPPRSARCCRTWDGGPQDRSCLGPSR